MTAYAPTLGWRDVDLSRVEYIVPPSDGIQDFVLHGTPPTGPAPTAIQIFPLTGILPEADWVRGARIQNTVGDTLLVLRTPIRGAEPIGDDWAGIEAAGLKGDKLIVDVRYGGGCADHHFQLAWDGSILKSMPGQVVFVLSHDANEDACKALVSERLQFDLSVILDRPEQYVIRVTSGTTEVVAHRPARNP